MLALKQLSEHNSPLPRPEKPLYVIINPSTLRTLLENLADVDVSYNKSDVNFSSFKVKRSQRFIVSPLPFHTLLAKPRKLGNSHHRYISLLSK